MSWTPSLARNSLVAEAVWAGALSWWRVMPDFGRRVRTAYSTWGRHWRTYQSAVTVRLSSSGVVVMCPILAMYEATISLLVLLDRLNFGGWVSPGKSQTNDWAFVSGSKWYTQISSYLTIFYIEFGRSLPYFSSMVKHHCTLPTFCSSVSWCGTHLAHRLWTASWWCRISFKADMPIPSMSWRSLQVIRASSLISSLTRAAFSWVAAETGWPQKLSSLKWLPPNSNSQNHLLTVDFLGAMNQKASDKFLWDTW